VGSDWLDHGVHHQRALKRSSRVQNQSLLGWNSDVAVVRH